MRGQNSLVQGDLGTLKDRGDGHGEVHAAFGFRAAIEPSRSADRVSPREGEEGDGGFPGLADFSLSPSVGALLERL
jgi:hypothetical protein